MAEDELNEVLSSWGCPCYVINILSVPFTMSLYLAYRGRVVRPDMWNPRHLGLGSKTLVSQGLIQPYIPQALWLQTPCWAGVGDEQKDRSTNKHRQLTRNFSTMARQGNTQRKEQWILRPMINKEGLREEMAFQFRRIKDNDEGQDEDTERP
jgi:hypothetical protein